MWNFLKYIFAASSDPSSAYYENKLKEPSLSEEVKEILRARIATERASQKRENIIPVFQKHTPEAIIQALQIMKKKVIEDIGKKSYETYTNFKQSKPEKAQADTIEYIKARVKEFNSKDLAKFELN